MEQVKHVHVWNFTILSVAKMFNFKIYDLNIFFYILLNIHIYNKTDKTKLSLKVLLKIWNFWKSSKDFKGHLVYLFVDMYILWIAAIISIFVINMAIIYVDNMECSQNNR